jgi:hypothetical protein
MSKALQYNLDESKRIGWNASILGLSKIDEDFVEAVKAFQKQYNLAADGMLGPNTYRRIMLEKDREDDVKPSKPTWSGSRIICNGIDVPLKSGKAITWKDKDGLVLTKGFSKKTSRKPSLFVTHWDVCLSAKSCHNVLKERGLSVHFSIDNDGTIYQYLDTVHVAWHAAPANEASIGVEVSNAYYPKHQDWYVKNGFGPRPLTKSVKAHGGMLEPHLDFYDAQYEALASLWEAIHRAHGIPLELPHRLDKTIDWSGFTGFVNHFHITDRKIDCFGMDHDRVLNRAIQLSNS